jgi:hypothetical protein
VKVTEQVATPGLLWLSVHGLPPKLPAWSTEKLTVPVGVLVTPASVSVTVAMQVVVWPATTGLGEQLTAVEVESGGV